MSDKELIKQEIKRRIESMNSCPFKTAELGSEKFDEGELYAYKQILQFIDSLPEEHNEDLEEYAKKLAKGAALDKHNLIWMCKKGAEWQKQQMMKNAVNGEVVYQIGSSVIAPTDIRYKVISDRVYIPNVKLGDKVKIIICKTEQQ